MSPMLVFVALVGFAFLGGLGRRGASQLGLGAEFLVAGVILGPAILGLVSRETLDGFQPLMLMGLGWIGACIGLRHGTVAGEFVGFRLYTAGLLRGVFVVLALGALAFWVSRYDPELGGGHGVAFALLASGALTAALGGGVHPAELGVDQGWRVRIGLGTAANGPALLALALVIVFRTPPLSAPGSAGVWALVGPGLGLVFGVTVAALLGERLRYGEFWSVFLGAVLLSVGLSFRFHVALLPVAFTLGFSVALLSPLRKAIRSLTEKTEATVLLPFLVLTGALVVWPATRNHWLIAGALVLGRGVILYASGQISAWALGARDGHALGLSLLPLGSLGIGMGVAAFFRQPAPLGSVVLLAVTLSAVLGEVLGGRALERLFARNAPRAGSPPAGEIASATSPPAPIGGAPT